MFSYYTALILLSWMALGVLCVLVHENSWIPQPDKRQFYLTYGIIALSALAEWVGIQLRGNDSVPRWVLLLVKCADYTLTPMAGGAIVAQMKLRNRWNTALNALLLANVAFQIVACFNGWMIVTGDHNTYTHGPLYPVYIGIYVLVLVITAIEFLIYGKDFRNQNKASLYAVLLLVIVGIGLQETLGGESRTAYIALVLGAALMFIHYSEFYQQAAQEHMLKQRNQLMTDALTGALSRHAFSMALKKHDSAERMPKDAAAFTIDINGLKSINDRLGHDAGDELIVGAVHCIERAVGKAGKCYRTGGDEFVVLGRMDRAQAEALLKRLETEAGAWSGETVKVLSLSVGCALACDHEGLNAERLVREADQAMYIAKADYYKRSGLDRRGSR